MNTDEHKEKTISDQQARLSLLGPEPSSSVSEIEWARQNSTIYKVDGHFVPLATANASLFREVGNL